LVEKFADESSRSNFATISDVSWRSETLAKLQAKEQATSQPVRFFSGS